LLPRERDLPKLAVLALVWASLFPVFSGGLESVLEALCCAVDDQQAIPRIHAGFQGVVIYLIADGRRDMQSVLARCLLGA
jgi:hypothetical protein